MTKNTYLVIGLVLVFIIASLVFIKQKGGGDVLAPTGEEVQVSQETTAIPTDQVPSAIVTYTDSGFNPATMTVRAGEPVSFINNSSRDFWPASGPHPTHTNYPEFDAKLAIPPEGSYTFTFTKPGPWKYHDHLNPALTGTITVQ